MANKKLTPEIETILRAARIEGDRLYLQGQLDQKTYKEVAKVIELCGGKWNRGQKCHIFASDPNKILFALEKSEKGEAVEIVDEKKLYQAFYTPQWLVEKVVEIADVEGKRILEPSCGDGRFIRECFKQGASDIDAVEINEEQAEGIMPEFFGRIAIHVGDFLKFVPSQDDNFSPSYDIVIGNPPYSKNNWLKHTVHAYKFVDKGGKLMFILPNTLNDPKFQKFVSDKTWEYEDVAEGAFKESGTNIATKIVTIYK